MTTSELPRSSSADPLLGLTEPVIDHVHPQGKHEAAHHHETHEHEAHENPIRHPHVHSEESLRRVINRLSRIEGHIRGIKVMVQESRACPDVLVQLAAVRGAIDRVSRIILDEHLTSCIARAAQEGNIEDEIEELKAALDRFLP